LRCWGGRLPSPHRSTAPRRFFWIHVFSAVRMCNASVHIPHYRGLSPFRCRSFSFCRGLAPTGPVPAGGPPAQKPIVRRVRHSFLLYKSVSLHPQSRLSIRCFRVAGTGLVFVLPGTVPLWDCPHLIAGFFHSAGDCTAPLHPAIYHKVLNDPPPIIIFADFPLYAGCSGSSNPPIGSAPKQSDLTVLQGTVHGDIA